ncbi:ABC transporter ATP-binding protein [Longimicrobium sp.]|uniref:ABC transporter ATP-binding protein n=1 Tax=Longimicrobium sp. TaxID=2029185 RepID=UPI002D1896D2|nr:ABC transporter ATP-binding protein [Longimicrobium sp.]HSU14504.1 ABC transporter ATP-binding protein [Longimicrobium sp.]
MTEPAAAPPVIEIAGLSKHYGDRVAVDGLTFSVPPGEIVGLVGPNGAGKTTTLRAIAGIHPPSSGTIRVAGFDVVRHPVEARRHLAMVPDEPALFASLTVWEHLEFTARIYGVRDWRGPAAALLDEMELGDRRQSLADELSRGMRQKVAVACALLHDPAALLFDEPLTGLDPRGIRTLYEAIRRRAAEGAAVLLSSHLLGQIETLCTGFAVMRQGRLLFAGTREEMRDRYAQVGGSLEEVFFHLTEGAAPPVMEAGAR